LKKQTLAKELSGLYSEKMLMKAKVALRQKIVKLEVAIKAAYSQREANNSVGIVH